MIARWGGAVSLGLAFIAGGRAAEPAAPAASPIVAHLALVSDTHTSHAAAHEDQALYRGRLDRVIAAVNAAKVDLVLIAGDLTQDGKDEDFDDFVAQIKGFTAPVFCAPGNHDLGPKRIAGKQDGPSAERLARYERKVGLTYFARTQAGVRIIGLNSPILGSDSPLEQRMWSWLEHEFAHPVPQPTIVFMHYPPFTKSPDEPGGGYWNIEPEPRRHLLALLHQAGARTVLTGHLHFPLVTHDGATTFISTLPVSFGLPRGKQPQGWTFISLHANGEAEHEFRTVND